jgi:hypothetical protein
MGDLDSVVCPRCKIGCSPDTALCPICNIPLVSEDRFEDEPEDEYEETPVAVILTDDLLSLKELRAANPEWIYHLQEKLAEAGIPHRIEISKHRLTRCTVYVRQEDLVKAKEIDDKVFAQEVPDGERMSRPEDLDFWTCPGCGNRLGEKDLKCSSCGLVLHPAEGWTCPNCDGVVGVDVKVCPHCGTGID